MIAGSVLRGSALRAPAPDNSSSAPVVKVRRRIARGIVAGSICGALTYAVIDGGAFGSMGSVSLAILLLVAAPTAPHLAPRLAVNVALMLGVMPTLWWFRWPVDVNHAGLVVAAGYGIVAMYVGVAPAVGARLRILLPASGGVDLLMLPGLIVSFYAVHKLFMAKTSVAALAELLPGVDNHVHVGIFVSLRRTGVILSSAGAAPDGSAWAWANYPSGFHTIVATISELLSPAIPLSSAVFVSYARSVALLVMLGIVLVTSAVLAMPSVRRHPALAGVAVTAMWGALLWDPGQKALANGFGNFWLAAAMAGAALSLIMLPRLPGTVPTFAAMLMLLMGVAQAWILLLVPAIPVALVALSDMWSYWRCGGTARIVVCVALPAVSLFGFFQAAILALRAGDLTSLVVAAGALDGTSPVPTFVMLVISAYVLFGHKRLVASQGADPTALARRTMMAAAGPVLGGIVALGFLVAQLQVIGTSSYYFLKYVTGLELAMAVLVPALTAHLISFSGFVPLTRATWRTCIAATTAAFMAAAAFGWPRAAPALLLSDSNDGTAGIAPPYSRIGMAEGIVRALDGGGRPFQDIYLAMGSRRAGQAFYPDAWFHSGGGALTENRGKTIDIMRRPGATAQEGAEIAEEVLRSGLPGRVIVAPRDVETVRDEIEDPTLRPRVVGWDSL